MSSQGVESTEVVSEVEKLESLPPFPLLSNILKSFLQVDHDGDIRPLISNIESEPSITAKVIGMANSAFFGSGSNIKTVRDATARLGLLQLKSIVYSLVLSSRFNTKQCPHFEVGRFWFNSMMQGRCARTLMTEAKIENTFDINQLFAVGLLQRIGMLALIELNPEAMDSVLSGKLGTLLNREKAVLGINHYEAGSILLKKWSLPEAFHTILEVYNDDDYEGEYKPVILALKRSSELVEGGIDAVNKDLDDQLGLDEDALCRILNKMETDSNWIKSFASHL